MLKKLAQNNPHYGLPVIASVKCKRIEMTSEAANDNATPLCSECFADEGLRIDAAKYGLEQQDACPNCKSTEGRKEIGSSL